MLVKKNLVIMHPCDKVACAFYRCHAMAMTLNSDKGGEVETIVSRAEINDGKSVLVFISSTPF